MLSFAYLKEADLAPLATAADSWKGLPAKYQSLRDEFTRRVLDRLEGHWEGDAAESAFATMKKARKQYEDAAVEAGRIARLLADAHDEFSTYQKQLHALLEEAPGDGFRISDKGVIEDVDKRWDSPTASAAEGFATERKEAWSPA
ncbi:PPE domain-containing protein [Streptomyces sp. HUAS MG91]|uniref:PPE domain-containing protein n=1 Tax=Streptomyces tabacisoli TaxID=3156398 RepID=A0AAU8IWF4_9ACTN